MVWLGQWNQRKVGHNRTNMKTWFPLSARFLPTIYLPHSVISYKWKPPYDWLTCAHLLWETNQAAHRLHMSLIWPQWPTCSWQRLGISSCLSAAAVAWVHPTPLTRPRAVQPKHQVSDSEGALCRHLAQLITQQQTLSSSLKIYDCKERSGHSHKRFEEPYACPVELQSQDPRPQTDWFKIQDPLKSCRCCFPPYQHIPK